MKSFVLPPAPTEACLVMPRLPCLWLRLFTLAVILGGALLQPCLTLPVCAAETWERLDKRIKSQVYQLNVGIKLSVKGGLCAQYSDQSPKFHYPVFSTSKEDRGYLIVGWGSTFPIKTILHDKVYFVTNRHVVDSGESLVKECQRFYAGMRLYAEQTGEQDPEGRYKEVMQIINLCLKKNMSTSERTTYQSTADGIWNTYDTYLSMKADPARVLFNRYLKAAGVEDQIGYFLHAPGPATEAALPAVLYKVARAVDDPDIAIMTTTGSVPAELEFDPVPPSEGQEIQVIGYPRASEIIDVDTAKYYSPTFSTGRISRVAPRLIQVDAPITNGNSGGPVISLRGKVLGVVARRALSGGQELANFGGAVSAASVESFAPELFGKTA
ncbi:MAG TPA: serine protease, partial [Chroococcales cyanobacterium]